MVESFSSICIATHDIGASTEEYRWLLGDPSVSTLPLSNVAIEIKEDQDATSPRIDGLALFDPEGTPLPADLRGLPITVVTERHENYAENETGICAVDHLVLRTADADDCIRLFGEQLGMRLALDQMVPEWGGRMLFFRHGKMTLEVIQHLDDPVEQDYFWGITYLCPDLQRTVDALDKLEVAHSEIRDGRKPGTRVATVKSHTLGIPTLLIEPAAR